ncbi:MAG: 23S rRNA (uracil(1939)-C(5))-methyltransferase RlmD [Acidimicrobiia bacterium]|nr:MAG: 23S rRNA (uracil(1939)-C(5))-methyltransferase RlmD [Acidimicrobiia bacterium]
MELHPHDMAHGGEAVARRDGKAYFVPGAMPGEVVEATVVEDKGSWARTALVDLLARSPDRREPPCPHASACGGCQWQFADESQQRHWKRSTVIGQLQHLGKIEAPVVHDTVAPGSDLAYRNRMDFRVVNGIPALYRERSNDLVPLSRCLLMVPELQAVYAKLGDLSGVEHLTLRAGTQTGDVVAIVEGELPEQVADWGTSVIHRTRRSTRTVIGTDTLTEVVDGATFEIPADGFFQNNTAGAETLVRLVRDLLETEPHETLLDGYCGVGLFGATVGAGAARVIGIESAKRAVEFARRNLSAAGVDHHIVAGSFTRDIEKLDEYWDVAVVDPPRKGLGERGVEAVTAAMPRRVAYVACDPASLARDTRTLASYGYEFIEATPVDMFPQTYHIEIVARFDRMPLEDQE